MGNVFGKAKSTTKGQSTSGGDDDNVMGSGNRADGYGERAREEQTNVCKACTSVAAYEEIYPFCDRPGYGKDDCEDEYNEYVKTSICTHDCKSGVYLGGFEGATGKDTVAWIVAGIILLVATICGVIGYATTTYRPRGSSD